MKPNHFPLLTAAVSLVMVLLANGASARPTTDASGLPAVIRSCTEANVYYELVGQATTGEVTSYYLRSSGYQGAEFNPLNDWYTLITTRSGQCFRQTGASSPQTSLSHYVGRDAARQLSLARFEAEIAALGGKAAFEAQLDRMLNPQPNTAFEGVTIYFSEEQVWALQQLGVRFDRSYRLIP